MEEIFSSSSSKIIEKQLDLATTSTTTTTTTACDEFIDKDLDFYFDIDRISSWIRDIKFSRVALQFPDELLHKSILVCARLKLKSPHTTFFILADTSYGNCCADVVAAQHYQADSLVHFGHSCLSPVEKLPVFYAFDKLPLDLDLVASKLEKISNTKKIILLYDIAYFYLYDKMVEKFSSNPNIYVSKVEIPCGESVDANKMNEEHNKQQTRVLFSRSFPIDVKNSQDSYEIVYMGGRETTLTPLMFYFNRNKFWKLDPITNEEITLDEVVFARTNRELMKRYYLIEKARDSKIFGILVGTMSVAKYREAIRHVEGVLKKASRRYYSFLIGKLNCPKLNNFMEVDMYVIVSCNENSLINSKELNKPIITVFELEMAFNCARVWGDEFVCDFKQLLPGSEHFVETQLTDKESDVSLITGETRFTSSTTTTSDEADKKSVTSRNDGLAMMHFDGAGEFLSQRSWTGLEQNLGQIPVTKAVEGKKGIAASYDHESKT